MSTLGIYKIYVLWYVSWVAMASTVEKLQQDRYYELKNGAAWKKKNRTLLRKDAACRTITKQLRDRLISVDTYVAKVINIMNERNK